MFDDRPTFSEMVDAAPRWLAVLAAVVVLLACIIASCRGKT